MTKPPQVNTIFKLGGRQNPPPAEPSQSVLVVVETPRYSAVAAPLRYACERALPPGTLVRVPLGKREVLGVVWADSDPPAVDDKAITLRPLVQVFGALPPLPPSWRALVSFAAGYYQRAVGELALSVLPPELRRLDAAALTRRVDRLRKAWQAVSTEPPTAAVAVDAPALSADQQRALQVLEALRAQPQPPPLLLWGVTGSGKTEVYLRATAATLESGRQALVLVPEINLTPQLEARFAARFPGRRIAAVHSALTPAQRLRGWLAVLMGQVDIVLGTRLAVFSPLPRLGLVVVDEEHDPSYKQQEGARYSARDLAVWRGRAEGVPVLLGSATPSLESWQRAAHDNAVPAAAASVGSRAPRYRRVDMAERIAGAALPRVRLVDMTALPRPAAARTPPVLAPAVLDALRQCLARGEQSLVFLNRRGYAPVLHCADCGWKSGCPHCSAWRVFHKRERSLRCHHCGFGEPVPRACPDCGNLDIAPIGRGTEKLEEQLVELLPQARIARLDADTARGKGQLESRLAEVHAGEVDILVGTQMVTKGHDFRRITLVVAVNPDGVLFTSDFRAGERLFALLMQAAGRAGRDAANASESQMWVQTWHPRHPLYQALQRHDFAAFAAATLAERAAAGLPPHSHLALLRAEARDAAVASAFLHAATDGALAQSDVAGVTLYPPVPTPINKVAGIERMQMLLESRSRTQLQRLLAAWVPTLHALHRQHKGLARWAVDVDPLAI